MIILSIDAQKELDALGFRSHVVTDRQLFCPSSAWLNDFTGYLKDHSRPAQGEAWDCDDYAFWARALASEANAAAGHLTGHAFLFCSIGLYDSTNGIESSSSGPLGHATNLVRTSDKGWLLYEPQTGKWCDLRGAVESGAVAPRLAII